jgi:hypothetical protein
MRDTEAVAVGTALFPCKPVPETEKSVVRHGRLETVTVRVFLPGWIQTVTMTRRTGMPTVILGRQVTVSSPPPAAAGRARGPVTRTDAGVPGGLRALHLENRTGGISRDNPG